MSSDPGPDEVYCIECGEIIRERAEICPECGVRQPNASGDQHSGGGPQRGQQSPAPGRTQGGQPGAPGPNQRGQRGARGPNQGGQPAQNYNARQQQAGGQRRQDIGIIFAHVDANRRKKLLRNLLDLALALSSVGLYLGVMIGEGIRHYYKLKRGSREPFDPERHEKTWLV